MSRLSNNDIVAIGATVGGHGLLLAVIALGLLGMEEKIEKPESLSVELVGEGSPEPVTGDVGVASAAPKIVEESPEESAEPAEETSEVEDTRAAEAAAERANEAAKAKADAARAAANAKAAADAAKRADATAAQKRQAKEAAEKAARLKREQEAADRKAKAAREKAAKEKAAKDKAAKDKAARDKTAKEKAAKDKAAKDKAAREKAAREFEGIGDKLGGNASATADQARSKASATIGAEVRPAVAANCKLSAGEPSSLQVFVTMTINKNRTLASASVYDVRGTTPQNSSQVEPAKQCVLKSLRSVSPYNLNEADYDVWKNHKVQIKVNLK